MFSLIILALLVLGGVLFLWWKQKRMRAVSMSAAKKSWTKLDAIPDPGRRILEAQSIVDRALNTIGYRGTFGEKLKRIQSHHQEFSDVWEALKLRNRIAHEPGTRVTEKEAQKALKAFKRFLHTL